MRKRRKDTGMMSSRINSTMSKVTTEVKTGSSNLKSHQIRLYVDKIQLVKVLVLTNTFLAHYLE